MHSRSKEGKRKTSDNQGLKLSAVVTVSALHIESQSSARAVSALTY